MRNHLRTPHYGYRTEQRYVFWVRRFILFHGKRHPADMAALEIEAFLTLLAVDRQVSASTQNQALAALLFTYQKVLNIELPWLDGIAREVAPPLAGRAHGRGKPGTCCHRCRASTGCSHHRRRQDHTGTSSGR